MAYKEYISLHKNINQCLYVFSAAKIEHCLVFCFKDLTTLCLCLYDFATKHTLNITIYSFTNLQKYYTTK